MSGCKHLKHVDLSKNEIGIRSAFVGRVFCECVEELESLDLSCTGMTDESSVEKLLSQQKLKKVKLDGNKIGNEGATKIAAALGLLFCFY